MKKTLTVDQSDKLYRGFLNKAEIIRDVLYFENTKIKVFLDILKKYTTDPEKEPKQGVQRFLEELTAVINNKDNNFTQIMIEELKKIEENIASEWPFMDKIIVQPVSLPYYRLPDDLLHNHLEPEQQIAFLSKVLKELESGKIRPEDLLPRLRSKAFSRNPIYSFINSETTLKEMIRNIERGCIDKLKKLISTAQETLMTGAALDSTLIDSLNNVKEALVSSGAIKGDPSELSKELDAIVQISKCNEDIIVLIGKCNEDIVDAEKLENQDETFFATIISNIIDKLKDSLEEIKLLVGKFPANSNVAIAGNKTIKIYNAGLAKNYYYIAKIDFDKNKESIEEAKYRLEEYQPIIDGGGVLTEEQKQDLERLASILYNINNKNLKQESEVVQNKIKTFLNQSSANAGGSEEVKLSDDVINNLEKSKASVEKATEETVGEAKEDDSFANKKLS